MSTFTHNGIEIVLNESSGKFSAVINGEKVTSTSLAGIKKRIDKPIAFEPFQALVIGYGDLNEITIVRTAKNKMKSGFRSPVFVWVDDRNREHENVIPNTEEARNAFAHWQSIRDANREKIEQLNGEIQTARAAIPSIEAKS